MRAEIEECDSHEALMAIQTDLLTQFDDRMAAIKEAFKDIDKGPEVVQRIKVLVDEARYFEKMLDEVSAREEALGS